PPFVGRGRRRSSANWQFAWLRRRHEKWERRKLAVCATVSRPSAEMKQIMSQFEYQEFYSRNLPHIQPPEATLFVTFRLDGSIPAPVIEKWRMEKRLLKATLLKWEATAQPGTIPDLDSMTEEKLRFHRRWFQKFEDVMHTEKIGPLWLRDP